MKPALDAPRADAKQVLTLTLGLWLPVLGLTGLLAYTLLLAARAFEPVPADALRMQPPTQERRGLKEHGRMALAVRADVAAEWSRWGAAERARVPGPAAAGAATAQVWP